MTTVTIFRDHQGEAIGFSVSGHTGYEVEGKDIVCASVSTAAQLTANTIVSITDKASIDYDAGRPAIRCFIGEKARKKDVSAVQPLLNSFEQLIEGLVMQYPMNVYLMFCNVERKR
jgi:uncharacterized protein YsxB (DUF464 family)